MQPLNTKSGLEELIAQLEGKDKPVLSLENREAMKQKLMVKISLVPHQRPSYSIYSLATAVRVLAQKLKIDNVKKAEVKERVMEGIENGQRKFFFGFVQRALSGALVVMIAFGVFSFVGMGNHVVMAGTFTMLDSFSGTVSVKRGGKIVRPKFGTVLMENDNLITGIDGSVVIRYFDNSVSRMANNTELVINKLVKPAGNSIDTYVEISVVNGKIWSRVLNLVESHSVFVVKSKDISTAAKKAAFNVDVDAGKVEVGVFNHAVSISSGNEVEQVITGEKLIVQRGAKNIQQIDAKEKDTNWVKANLSDDRAYLSQVEKRLLEAKRKIASASKVVEASEISSFSEVNKKKSGLDLAEKNFVAAQVKLSDAAISTGEKEAAQKAMQDFGQAVKDFYGLVDEVALTDKTYADELRAYVDAKVLIQKRDLPVALPDTPNYEAKKILDDAQLVGVNDEVEKMRLKVDQAADKLSVAEDVKASGNEELAKKVVDEYKQDMTGVAKMMVSLQAGNRADVKEEMALKVSDNMDLLKAIDVVSEQKVVEVQKVVAPLIDTGVVVEVKVKESVETAEVVDRPFGVTMDGDKPLPPLLQNGE